MSYQEPAASGYELTASEIDPAHHAIVPSDDTQDLAFRSIRAIDPRALAPHGPASLEPARRTPKGIRPMIWIRLNETKSAIVFEVTLHTGQCVQVHVPFDSWRLGTLEPECVRAAIQKAYLNLLRHKPDPAIVKPGMLCLKVLSKHDPQHRSPMQTLQYSNARQSSLESNSTRTSLDSSRYTSSHNTGHTRSRSQGSRTPHRSHSHPVPATAHGHGHAIPSQPPVRPNVLTRLSTAGRTNSRSQPASPIHPPPYVNITHSGQAPYVRVKQQAQAPTGSAGFDPYAARYY